MSMTEGNKKIIRSIYKKCDKLIDKKYYLIGTENDLYINKDTKFGICSAIVSQRGNEVCLNGVFNNNRSFDKDMDELATMFYEASETLDAYYILNILEEYREYSSQISKIKRPEYKKECYS